MVACCDGLCADAADARNLLKSLRLFAQDAQRVGAEGGDNFLGGRRADAADDAGAEKGNEALLRGGLQLLRRRKSELPAEAGMHRPLSHKPVRAALLGQGEQTHAGKPFALFALRLENRDGVGVGFVMKDDFAELSGLLFLHGSS